VDVNVEYEFIIFSVNIFQRDTASLSSVHTVYPCPRAVSTGRVHGRELGCHFDTRVQGGHG